MLMSLSSCITTTGTAPQTLDATADKKRIIVINALDEKYEVHHFGATIYGQLEASIKPNWSINQLFVKYINALNEESRFVVEPYLGSTLGKLEFIQNQGQQGAYNLQPHLELLKKVSSSEKPNFILIVTESKRIGLQSKDHYVSGFGYMKQGIHEYDYAQISAILIDPTTFEPLGRSSGNMVAKLSDKEDLYSLKDMSSEQDKNKFKGSTVEKMMNNAPSAYQTKSEFEPISPEDIDSMKPAVSNLMQKAITDAAKQLHIL